MKIPVVKAAYLFPFYGNNDFVFDIVSGKHKKKCCKKYKDGKRCKDCPKKKK